MNCYTSQPKYVFRLKENVSRAVRQNSLTLLRRTKLTNSEGRTKLGNNNLNFTHVTPANLSASRRQANDLFRCFFCFCSFVCLFFSFFELGGITKYFMTGPAGNSEFCFPSTSMFSSASRQGTQRVLGIQNSLFPAGPVIKYLMTKFNLVWKTNRTAT